MSAVVSAHARCGKWPCVGRALRRGGVGRGQLVLEGFEADPMDPKLVKFRDPTREKARVEREAREAAEEKEGATGRKVRDSKKNLRSAARSNAASVQFVPGRWLLAFDSAALVLKQERGVCVYLLVLSTALGCCAVLCCAVLCYGWWVALRARAALAAGARSWTAWSGGRSGGGRRASSLRSRRSTRRRRRRRARASRSSSGTPPSSLSLSLSLSLPFHSLSLSLLPSTRAFPAVNPCVAISWRDGPCLSLS
eukprot:3932606-Rhodomonas_salina.3